MNKKEKINVLLTRGVENIYPDRDFLEKKLKSGKQLSLYLGVDPTGSSLHLGHAIVLMKLKEFQDLGHKVILLIGSFTGMIGDPSGKTNVRKQLTEEEVKKNYKDYKKQAGLILNFSGKNPAVIKYNHQWWNKMTGKKLINLATNFTVQQMLARDMFKKRIEQDREIFMHEFFYPLIQAYDSLVLSVDGEIGGNDQMFNMLAGRDLIKKIENREKFVLTTKLLVDPTGKKMGKTEGNMINLTTSPKEMFGRIMSWPDELIIPGLELCTKVEMKEIEKYGKELGKKLNPRDLKMRLAREIVEIYHNKSAALKAEKEFIKIFKEKEIPSEMKIVKIKDRELNILDLLIKIKLIESKAQGRRLIEQNAVKIDRIIVENWQEVIKIKKGLLIQVGKRKFVKLDRD